MSSPSPAPVSEGDVLAGKYRVEKLLGVGGMGVVVSAMHLQLEQRVALKFLLPAVLQQREIVERFAREARAAARIKSEHVARVIDVGELDTGSPYMVMEFLEGEDLEKVLEQRGPLPVGDAVSFVLQACDALAEAHAAGIVHRDLKPANLFLALRPDKTSIVKVLDFGISTAASAEGVGQLTKTQGMLGSPYYMSPEQLTAPKSVDARSDIWALGVILHELTTAHRPFDAETMPELIAAILQAVPPPISRLRPDAPPALVAIIEQCLSKDRDSRFASVAALANALGPMAPEESRRFVARISRILGKEVALGLAPIPSPSAVSAPPSSELAGEPSNGSANPNPAWGATQPDPETPVHALPTRALLVIGAVAIVATLAFGAVHLFSGTKPTGARMVPSERAEPPSPSGSVVIAASAPASAPRPEPTAAIGAGATTTTRPGGAAHADAGTGTAVSRPLQTKAHPGIAIGTATVAPASPPEHPTPLPLAAPDPNKMKMEFKE